MSIKSITLNVLADITKNINVDDSYAVGERGLIVFTGSNIDLISRINEMKDLKKDMSFDIAFSFMSENIIDKDRVLSELQPEKVFTEEDVFDLDMISKRYKYLIGPNITMNTISKVSSGMIDSFISTIIWTFLYNDKKVFLDYEAVRNYLGKKTNNKAIEKMIDERIDALGEMGAEELTNGNYREEILDREKISSTSKKSNSTQKFKSSKRVITSGDLKELTGNSLILEKGDIITPLAKDKVKELDIEVKIKN